MATLLNTNPVQHTSEVGENPLALSREVASEMVQAMNEDLSSFYALYHQTKKHHWIVSGAERQEIHLLLDQHSKQQLEAADAIAERIVDLGGVPVSTMSGQETTSYLQLEPEGAFPIRMMLENDVYASRQVILKLREHIALAIRLGDYATEYLLKETLYGQEKRTNDLNDHLADDTLVIRR
jgi:DNA-binding ferritin-like protein